MLINPMLGLNTWHSEIDNELEQQGLAAGHRHY